MKKDDADLVFIVPKIEKDNSKLVVEQPKKRPPVEGDVESEYKIKMPSPINYRAKY